MSGFWDGVKQKAAEVGNAAKIQGLKTKIRGDMLLLDRSIKQRQYAFGVELFDFVAPLSKQVNFFAANDRLTNTLRPPLLEAQREIAALQIRVQKLKEQQAQAEVKREAAFAVRAQSFGGKLKNMGKSTVLAGSETKTSTELAIVNSQIKGHKQTFGVKLFEAFVELEDKEGWLPTNRDIRSFYDQARRDIENLMEQKAAKEQELKSLGGGGSGNTGPDVSVAVAVNHNDLSLSQQTDLYGSPVPAALATPQPQQAADMDNYSFSEGSFLSAQSPPRPVQPTAPPSVFDNFSQYNQQQSVSQQQQQQSLFGDSSAMGGYSAPQQPSAPQQRQVPQPQHSKDYFDDMML